MSEGQPVRVELSAETCDATPIFFHFESKQHGMVILAAEFGLLRVGVGFWCNIRILVKVA